MTPFLCDTSVVCIIRTLVGTQKWGPTYGYACCRPLCNRTNPARVATFRCFVPQLERATRATGRVPLGRPYSSTPHSHYGPRGKGPSPIVDCVNDRESLDCEADEPSDADDGVLDSVDSSTVVHILYVM